MSRLRLNFATGNPHKVQELQTLADTSDLTVEIVRAAAMPKVDEDTGTFVGNARKKAVALQSVLPAGEWVLADDSGVCVDALGGAPGVESAYYAGPQGDFAANLRKLTEVMREVPAGHRGASFNCVLVLRGPGGAEEIFEGRCVGTLCVEPAGGSGFGYDPLFVPDGFTQTYAQIGDAEKNRISHRARAWTQLAAWLRSQRLWL